MNPTESQYEQKLNQLLAVTRTICTELDEIEDLSESRLEQLQSEQKLLRDQITALSVETAKSDHIQSMFEECLQLERQSLYKMRNHKQWALQQINGIHESSKARDAYRPNYSQTEGYFIDRQN